MTSMEALKNYLYQVKLQSPAGNDILQDKITELKNDPAFANWSDIQLEDYARNLIYESNATINSLNLNATFSSLSKPLDPKWSQYSYEEILQMEDNGVLIPEEFLEWAHSMQSTNTVEYELDTGDVNDINDSEGLKANIGDAGNMGKKNVAMVFNKQVKAQEELLKQATQEFEQYSSKLSNATDEAQAIQNTALKQIQDMVNEWQELDNKVKNGDELTDDEQSRYGQLGLMMNNVVQNSSMQIENFTSEFDEISKHMQSASKEAKIAQDYADDTSYVGDLITEYESSHKSRAVVGNNHIFDGATGMVDLLKSNTVGKNLAVTSIKSGGDLKDVTFDSDKSVKKVSSQIKDMIESVDIGNSIMDKRVAQGEDTSAQAITVGDEQTIEPAPTEDNPEIIAQINQNNEAEKEDDNVFTQEEDLNNINVILKRQQKQAPKIPPQDIITN